MTAAELERKCEELEEQLKKEMEAHECDRQKLRAMEEETKKLRTIMLLDGAARVGLSRRWQITFRLILVGGVLISVGTVLHPFQMFGAEGVNHDHGYATGLGAARARACLRHVHSSLAETQTCTLTF